MATITETLAKKKAARAKLDTEIAALEAQAQSADLLANLKPHDVVTFVFGRKENRGVKQGVVRSLIDTDKGRIVRVIMGEGIDEEIVNVKPSDIQNVQPQGADAERVFAQADAAESLIGGAGADPLASIQ